MRTTLLVVLLAIILGGKVVEQPITIIQSHLITEAKTVQEQKTPSIQSSVTFQKVTPTPTQIITPTPTPQPTQVVIAENYDQPSVTEVVTYIQEVFKSQASIAECIARHESGFRWNATNHNWNGTWDVGVFQINDVHGLSWDYRMNYVNNINYAYQLSGGGYNWNAWTTKKYCL